MKRVLTIFMLVILAVVCLSVAGCELFGGSDPLVSLDLASGYTTGRIAWDNTLRLDSNEIPSKKGYDLLGWYDSETGGTLYIDKNGECQHKIEKNMELYIRYSAHEYTIKYIVPEGTQGLQTQDVSVLYDSEIPAFPKVTMPNHTLSGWYTAEKGGKQVATSTGINERMKTLSFDNYDLDENSRTLVFYARFDIDQFTVTLKFSGRADEILTVDYGTPVESIMYETRNADGFGVVAWSQSLNGNKFDGIVDRDMTLYANGEWAPVVELDYDGGEFGGALVVAREGEQLNLPTPQKSCSKFLGWKDEYGQDFTSTTMPENGAKLKASWQGILVFDSNGGTRVQNISEPANTNIELPKPTRDGYLFAGWFEENGSKFIETTMPREGKKLKAGWADAKRTTITWNPQRGYYYAGKGESDAIFLSLNTSTLDEPINLTGTWEVTLNISFECKHYSGSSIMFNGWNDLIFGIYSQKTLNSKYALVESRTYKHEKVQNYKPYSFTEVVNVTDGKLYLAFQASTINNGIYISDVKVEMIYPDLSTLEL